MNDGTAREDLGSTPSGKTAFDPGPSHPLRTRVEAFERSVISAEFSSANRNQSETARRLGISRPALIEKLHKYGLHGDR